MAHLLKQVQVSLVLLGQEPYVQNLSKAAFELLARENAAPPAIEMPTFETLFPGSTDSVEQLPPMNYENDDIATYMHSSGGRYCGWRRGSK